MCNVAPPSSGFGTNSNNFLNNNCNNLNRVATTVDARVDIHENLLLIKIPAKAVTQASGRPPAFLATVADEDLPTHWLLPRVSGVANSPKVPSLGSRDNRSYSTGSHRTYFVCYPLYVFLRTTTKLTDDRRKTENPTDHFPRLA
jgi:hypothetical protein